MTKSSSDLKRVNDIPSKPNRRKLTLGDFTSIIMTQISSPEEPLQAPAVKTKNSPHAK